MAGRRFSLTDDQVRDIQSWYQRHRYRGAIQALMQRYEASRNTIIAALSKTVPEKSSTMASNPQVSGGSEVGCTCTEATDPLLTTCGHPVTCRCRACKYHNRGLQMRSVYDLAEDRQVARIA